MLQGKERLANLVFERPPITRHFAARPFSRNFWSNSPKLVEMSANLHVSFHVFLVCLSRGKPLERAAFLRKQLPLQESHKALKSNIRVGTAMVRACGTAPKKDLACPALAGLAFVVLDATCELYYTGWTSCCCGKRTVFLEVFPGSFLHRFCRSIFRSLNFLPFTP